MSDHHPARIHHQGTDHSKTDSARSADCPGPAASFGSVPVTAPANRHRP